MTVVAADVFMTVLYARAGTGIISDRLARLIWRGLRSLAGDRSGGRLLSFCGPLIVVGVLLAWSMLLVIGAGLIMHPHLGSSITRSSNGTPTDFVTAAFVAGSSLSIVGSSDFAPQSAVTKVLFLLNSAVGTSMISLTLTYLMQIYGALRERNAFCMRINALSGETGDAAQLLAHLFARGELSPGYTNLSELASDATNIKEAHHFYPVLFYFRFPEPHYSISRSLLVMLDAVSLIRSAFSGDADWLKNSGATVQLWSVSLLLLSTIKDTFLRPILSHDIEPDESGRDSWQARFADADRVLRQAGIGLADDERLAVELYAQQRRVWDHLIRAIGPSLGYEPSEIDTALAHLSG
jgi:hypothetical protein